MRKLQSVCILILAVFLILAQPPTTRAISDYEQAVLDTFSDRIIAFWPLTETGGITAYDISGNGYNATYSGATLASIAGPFVGMAPKFDGNNDYINADVVAYASNASTLSISCWVYPLSLPTSATRFILDRNPSRVVLGTAEVTGYGAYTTAWFGLLDDTKDSWRNLILVTSATISTLYENGTVVGTGSAYLVDTPTELALGSRYSKNSYFWHGYISDCVLISGTLTESEIEILNGEIPEPTPTSTARAPQLITSLSNGNQFEIEYRITAGDIAQVIPALMLIAFLAFLIILRMRK